MTPTATIAESLAADLRARALVFVDLMAAAGAVAVEIADLEARHRAAEHMAGIYHDARPTARELAVEVVHGYLSPLRPFVPFVTAESAARAAEELRSR